MAVSSGTPSFKQRTCGPHAVGLGLTVHIHTETNRRVCPPVTSEKDLSCTCSDSRCWHRVPDPYYLHHTTTGIDLGYQQAIIPVQVPTAAIVPGIAFTEHHLPAGGQLSGDRLGAGQVDGGDKVIVGASH